MKKQRSKKALLQDYANVSKKEAIIVFMPPVKRQQAAYEIEADAFGANDAGLEKANPGLAKIKKRS